MSATEDWREYFYRKEREEREERERARAAASPKTADPGWYPQPDGRLRYWDGTAWTTHFRRGASLDQAPPGHAIPPMPQSATSASASTRPSSTQSALLGLARAKASRMMMWGVLICIAGVVITVVSYAEAAPGETYGIMWGAIVFGGWRFFRGLYFYANPEKLLR